MTATMMSDSRERLDSGSASRGNSKKRQRGGAGSKRRRDDRVADENEGRKSYYERKYKKSKKRVKQLVDEQVTEKNKNSELISNHTNLMA